MRQTAFRLKSKLAGGASLQTYRNFVEADLSAADVLHRLNERKSVEHARFAMLRSPFYRDLYRDHGLSVSDLMDPAAFTSLPWVSKEMLRANFEAIKTEEATSRTSAVSRTGGSTGYPLHILRDQRFPARALEWRLLNWWGIEPWEDRGIITRHMLTGAGKLRHDIAWLPSRRVQLDAFHISDVTVASFVRQWNCIQPPFLLGYAGAVLDMARRLQRLGLSLAPPRAIAVTAAPLTAGVREDIERLIGGPCYDHYRAAEVPWIAGECALRNGQHVFSDVRRVEILDDAGGSVPDGTEGEVVVSDLTNRVFPIVRYRLGDISSLLPGVCGCGRALPRLGPISGRRSDTIRLPDGTTIAGALGHIFDATPLAVRQFEIVQSVNYDVLLRCIPGDTPGAMDGIRRAEHALRDAVRGKVPVTLEIADNIAQVGGKMRFVRSDAPAGPLVIRESPDAPPDLAVLVAIPTYRRQKKLDELLRTLPARITEVESSTSVSVLVVDNDPAGSSASVVAGSAGAVAARYVVESTPGIAAARNRALDEAAGVDLLVFIDDDERPLEGWLNGLITTWRSTRAAGVMGRVISVFDSDVDPWLLATGVFSRKERATGLELSAAAAGNLLLDLRQVRETGVRFDPDFGLAGGEDTLFSRSLVAAGRRIVWCNESCAEDFVPEQRLTRSWAMQRAFNGGNTAIHVALALEPALRNKLSIRLRGIVGGAARVVAGWLTHCRGKVAGNLVADARGSRTAHRGRGMLVGALGYRHRAYARD